MSSSLLARTAARLLAALVLALALAPPAYTESVAEAEDGALFSPDGYRIDRFRDPVPDALAGAVTVGTDAVRALIAADDPVLVDVLPEPPKPEGLPSTTLWMPPPRHNLPGSTWLPNVGYGQLSSGLESYFKENLERLTGGDKSKAIVVYCLEDCWMSWNAARRAIGYGYTRVYWYPEGTTGWEAAELPVAAAEPAPPGH